MRRKAVITGLGIVAPNGVGVDKYWDSLVKGQSGIRKIKSFDTKDFRCKVGGEIQNFDPEEWMDSSVARKSGRHSQLAVASAKLAVKDSGLNLEDLSDERTGASFGTTIGSPNELYAEQHARFLKRGPRGVLPTSSSEYTTHAITSHVCIELGINGPNVTIASGCSSGLDVVDWGCQNIENGNLDRAVVGASDTLLSDFAFATLDCLGILAKDCDEPGKACKPFDKNRNGSVVSEGSGAVVIESLESALQRNARIYAEFVSHASSNEAQNMIYTDKDGKSIVLAIQRAMARGNLEKNMIDYISAHGVGIPSMDLAESNAFKAYFEKDSYRIPVSSIKSMTGQSYAAGGAFQVVAVCKSLETGILPPTINYTTPDPECDLDYIPNKARHNKINYAMMNSQSAGGSQSVLILRKFNGNGNSTGNFSEGIN